MIFNSAKIVSAFSCRPANMSLNYGDTKGSLINRANFLKDIGIDYQTLVCAKQVHGDNFYFVQGEDKGKGSQDYHGAIEDTDGFITDKKGVPLAIFTADCLSLFLYDSKAPGIGLVHCGWKGSEKNIAGKAVKLMQGKFNTAAQDLLVGFGPCLRQCCYEVGPEFKDYFKDGLSNRGGHYFLDLIAVNRKQLLDTGIKENNIYDSGICTSCRNKEFFSFRRQGQSAGRMISVMMIR